MRLPAAASPMICLASCPGPEFTRAKPAMITDGSPNSVTAADAHKLTERS